MSTWQNNNSKFPPIANVISSYLFLGFINSTRYELYLVEWVLNPFRKWLGTSITMGDCSEGIPIDVTQGSESHKEITMKTWCRWTFVNLNQTLGSLISGGSLSEYLKHNKFWKIFSGNDQSNQYNYRCTIKFKV